MKPYVSILKIHLAIYINMHQCYVYQHAIQWITSCLYTSIRYLRCIQELNKNPQIITEAIQMILKREGNSDAYESLLELSRGEQLTHSDIESFINQLEISEEIRAELRSITPETYIGLAHKLK